MRFESWESYINAMLSQVKFRFDHKDIRAEYEEHMEDKLEFLMDCGMDEERAAREVLTEMGEPKSLGKALNEIHNPLLGWIWWVSRIAARYAVSVGIFLVLYVAVTEISDVLPNSDYKVLKNYGEVVCEYDIEKEFVIDDTTVFLEDVQLYDTNCVAIRYISRNKLFSRHPKNAFYFAERDKETFFDEDGNIYQALNISLGNGRNIKKTLIIDNFSPDADYLIIDWNQHGRSIFAKVPMNEEAKAGEQ